MPALDATGGSDREADRRRRRRRRRNTAMGQRGSTGIAKWVLGPPLYRLRLTNARIESAPRGTRSALC